MKILAQGIEAIYTDISEAFITQAKLSLIVSIVVASPIIFCTVWWFVRPALKKNERFYALCFLTSAAALFAVGIFLPIKEYFFWQLISLSPRGRESQGQCCQLGNM